MIPVVASNRIGREQFSESHIDFYGSSFIADQTGDIVQECSCAGSGDARAGEGSNGMSEAELIVHTFDLDSIRLQRAAWGLFRDRRPSLYGPLLSLDGQQH